MHGRMLRKERTVVNFGVTQAGSQRRKGVEGGPAEHMRVLGQRSGGEEENSQKKKMIDRYRGSISRNNLRPLWVQVPRNTIGKLGKTGRK